MRKRQFYFFSILFFLLISTVGHAKEKKEEKLEIHKIELGYPSPAIPFYHFIVELQLPEASMIEVEASVNGKVLRFTDLHRMGDNSDLNKPALTHRPPSGYGISQDGTLYNRPYSS